MVRDHRLFSYQEELRRLEEELLVRQRATVALSDDQSVRTGHNGSTRQSACLLVEINRQILLFCGRISYIPLVFPRYFP